MKFEVHNIINSGTWAGAVMAGAGALTLNQWLAVGGFVLAAAGFGVNVWHKISMVRLAKRELALKAGDLT